MAIENHPLIADAPVESPFSAEMKNPSATLKKTRRVAIAAIYISYPNQ